MLSTIIATLLLAGHVSAAQYSASLNAGWRFAVGLGTPAQTLHMLLDTGATNVAARGPLVASAGDEFYDASKSSTSKKIQGDTYKNCYGGGHCGSGVVFNDAVSVGNINLNMNFEVSKDNNGQGNDNPDQGGDFGMGFKLVMSDEPTESPTFLSAIKPKLDKYLFTVDYNENTSKGNVDFGFIDTDRYTSNIGYLPINSQTNGYWGVNFTGYAVGSGALQDHEWTSVVDTGTSFTEIPPDVLQAYCSKVTGADYNTDTLTCHYPCSTSLPNFVFGVNDHRAVISGTYLQKASTGSGDNCVSPLRGGDTNSVIFGQSIIPAQFLIFDHANARVGFANKGA